MATIQTEPYSPDSPDSPDNLLYIQIGVYRGYKQDILTLKLSKLENKLLICTECNGIAREAVFCEGKTICTLCTAGKPHEPNDDVRESVNGLNVICPLNYRGCEWKGELLQLEQHLLKCDHLLILCNQECSTILTQYDLTEHITNSCPMRNIPCKFCEDLCLAKNVNKHLTKCPAYILDCLQGCKERVRRDKMNEHTEIHCEMKKEPCPYHEFGCKTNSIAKRDVQTHQQEYVVSHQQCLYQQMKLSNKQLNIETAGINGRADHLEKICDEQKEQILNLEKVCSEQKEQITKNNKDVNKLKTELENQEKLNKNLQIVVEKLNFEIIYIRTIMKIQMNQELTSKELEFFDEFDWEITDVMNGIKKHLKMESPIFQLYDNILQCQATFYMNWGGLTELHISIKCLTDKTVPQTNQFCYYQVQLLKRSYEDTPIVKKGIINSVITGDYIRIANLGNEYLYSILPNDTLQIIIHLIPTL
ncbi:TNF receptor-associated factor 6-like isoform X13 [Oopsacas minuta]|uniref:TNF receptor-associated factor 6-like isoform X13 n=1 Tax=Oopsacas minuta TaxID=111878 RepID=A0AAV7JMJ0_9METZ|nr:TNF receptor-associated factor 6-like isoform X13 [Oopsacas minuta]